MLLFWAEFFEDLQKVRGRSRNTVLAYRRDLELYSAFRNTRAEVSAFFEFLEKQKLSIRSQARVISSVRTYMKFLEQQGEKCPELNVLRPPKVKAKLPVTLTFQEFEKLYQACPVEDSHKTARNQLTLVLLYGLGCRVSELVALELNDFNETARVLKITGKGQKERLLPVTDRIAENLSNYLREHRGHLLKGDSCRSILINDRGNTPSRVDVWRWLAAWSEKAGFDEPVHPHRFRHACATALLENGADLRSIQLLLGHASIQTTQIYTAVTTKNLVDTVREHHPLSHISDLGSEEKE